MKFKEVEGKTLSEAYHKALVALSDWGQISNCDDWNTTQKELSMVMYITEPLKEPMISKCFIGGPEELEQYRQEMLYGILDFEVEKGNWAYTYHQRYADQIQFVIDDLKRNPSSRRAVMLIRDNSVDMGSNDPACLQHIQYFIRENALDCVVLFRSNDACKATFMNAFALIKLQEMIAKELGVEIGTYTHIANSFHCYEKDFHMLEAYVNRIKNGADCTYDYTYEWKELMDDYAKYELPNKIEKLKN